jgi:hypothetical protein
MRCRYGLQHAKHGLMHAMEHSTISRLEKSEMTGPVFVAHKVNRVPAENWAILAVLISAFTKQ